MASFVQEWARLRERSSTTSSERPSRDRSAARPRSTSVGDARPPRVRDPVEAGRVARGVGRHGTRPGHPGGHGAGGERSGSRGFPWSYLAAHAATGHHAPRAPAGGPGCGGVPDGHTIALADDSRQVYLMDLEWAGRRPCRGPHPVGRGCPSSCARRRHAGRGALGRPARKGPSTTLPSGTSRRARRSRACPRISGWSTGFVSARTAGAWSRSRPLGPQSDAPVRWWAIVDDRRRVNFASPCAADQLSAQPGSGAADEGCPASRPFEFSDVAVSGLLDPRAGHGGLAGWPRWRGLRTHGAATCSPSAWSSGPRSSPCSAATTLCRTARPCSMGPSQRTRADGLRTGEVDQPRRTGPLGGRLVRRRTAAVLIPTRSVAMNATFA